MSLLFNIDIVLWVIIKLNMRKTQLHLLHPYSAVTIYILTAIFYVHLHILFSTNYSYFYRFY